MAGLVSVESGRCAAALLTEHRQGQAKCLETIFGELEGRRRLKEGYVFTMPTGGLWDPNELSRRFSRFVRRHALPRFRFHDLRHGYASLAFAAGVPLAVVSKSLGHSSIGITANVYTHILVDQSAIRRPPSTPTSGHHLPVRSAAKLARSGRLVDSDQRL